MLSTHGRALYINDLVFHLQVCIWLVWRYFWRIFRWNIEVIIRHISVAFGLSSVWTWHTSKLIINNKTTFLWIQFQFRGIFRWIIFQGIDISLNLNSNSTIAVVSEKGEKGNNIILEWNKKQLHQQDKTLSTRAVIGVPILLFPLELQTHALSGYNHLICTVPASWCSLQNTHIDLYITAHRIISQMWAQVYVLFLKLCYHQNNWVRNVALYLLGVSIVLTLLADIHVLEHFHSVLSTFTIN